MTEDELYSRLQAETGFIFVPKMNPEALKANGMPFPTLISSDGVKISFYLVYEETLKYMITGIYTPIEKRNQHLASNALKVILEATDKERIILELDPVRMDNTDKALTTTELVAWYKRHGFEQLVKDDTILTRIPKGRCYSDSRVFAREGHKNFPLETLKLMSEIWIVHGTFRKNGKRLRHSWVEMKHEIKKQTWWMVWETQLSRQFNREEFYANLKIKVTYRLTPNEQVKLSCHYKHDGSYTKRQRNFLKK